MKKLISVLMALLIVLSSLSCIGTMMAAAVNPVPGDINGDGIANNKDLTRLMKHLAGEDVDVIYETLDPNGDGTVNNKDLTRLMRYLAGESLSIYVGCIHEIEAVEAKMATCEEDGNIAYWRCTICNACFSDENRTNEITQEDTVIAAAHTYSSEWVYDQDNHWHAATCEHSELMHDKELHSFGDDHVCDICSFDNSDMYKLATPQSVAVAYDIVKWTRVPNAESYTVVVNNDYSYVTSYNECSLNSVKNSSGETLFADRTGINKHGEVNVVVYANGNEEYTKSDLSENVTYYYVPDSSESQASNKALAEDYGLGLGYNMVETGFYAGMQPGMAVFDTGKLLTIDTLTKPQVGTGGEGNAYYYTSLDEYVEKSSSEEYLKANVGIPDNKYFTAGLKADLSYNATENYTSHKYYCSYVSRAEQYTGIVTYGGQNNDYRIHCLSNQFLQDIRRESGNTKYLQTQDGLLEYLLKTYGTHAALGIVKGGHFSTTYSVWTDNEKDFSTAKSAFEVAANAKVVTFFNANLDVKDQGEHTIDLTHDSTKSQLKCSWYGGSVDYDPSKHEGGSFEAWSIDDSNDGPLAFTNNGAIAISSLIKSYEQEYGNLCEDGSSLGAAYEAYINICADDLYHELYDQYTYEPPFDIEVSEEDGRNILNIDLSMYQADGKLSAAGCSYFVDGIFTVYPNMLGQDIDAVRLIGAMDKEHTKKNLFEGFSLKLKGKWTSDVEVILENFGTVAASDYGIVDSTSIPKTTNVTVSYEGINIIKEKTGITHCYVNQDGTTCNLILDDSDIPAWDFSNVSIVDSVLSLPVAAKEQYTFAGWFDGEGRAICDYLGTLDKTYSFGADALTVYANWSPCTYTITLNNVGATTPGTDKIYQMYKVGYASTYPADENFTQISSVTVPKKTGYIFGGYYTAADVDSNKVAVTGEQQYIDSNGVINNVIGDYNVPANMAFKGDVMLYAKWTPITYNVEYIGTSDSSEGISVTGTVASTSHTYNSERYLASNSFVCPGKSFVCWNTKADGTGTNYYTDVNVKNLSSSNGAVVKLYAVWTDNIKITLQADDAVNSPLRAIFMMLDKTAVYSNPECTSQITRITAPAVPGYDFGGYYDSVENNGAIVSQVNGINKRINSDGTFNCSSYAELEDDDKTLEAMWILKSFVAEWENGVHYDVAVNRVTSPKAKVQTGALESGDTIYFGDTVEIVYTSHPGYKFVGRTDYGEVTGTNDVLELRYTITIDNDTIDNIRNTLDGVYTISTATTEGRKYTVTYNLNKATSTNAPSTQCYTNPSVANKVGIASYSKSYKLDIPTTDYYTFEGWYLADGTKIANKDGTSVNNWYYLENITVYAHWSTRFAYIKTAADLRNVTSNNANIDGYMVIADEINLSGSNWTPLATFSGKTFDGLGHKISNMTINSNASNVGMFSVLEGATVKNIELVNVNITNTSTTDACTGALAGTANNSTITNCYSSGTITTGHAPILTEDTPVAAKKYFKTSQICGYSNISLTGCSSDVHIKNIVHICADDKKITDSGRWDQHKDDLYLVDMLGVDKAWLVDQGITQIKITATVSSHDYGNDGYHHIYLYKGDQQDPNVDKDKLYLCTNEWTDTNDWALHSFVWNVNVSDIPDNNYLKVLYGASGDYNDDWQVGDLWITVEYV